MSQGGAREAGEPELLATAHDAGIHVIAVPTPFLVGPVNCYPIEDEPLTLVDTGPNSGTSLDSLEGQLATLGRRIEDLELIVITHPHMDHLGLLNILARRSGAEVAAIEELGPWVEDFEASAAGDDRYAQSIMRRRGVPDDLVKALGMVGAAPSAAGLRRLAAPDARASRPARPRRSWPADRRSRRGDRRTAEAPRPTRPASCSGCWWTVPSAPTRSPSGCGATSP